MKPIEALICVSDQFWTDSDLRSMICTLPIVRAGLNNFIWDALCRGSFSDIRRRITDACN